MDVDIATDAVHAKTHVNELRCTRRTGGNLDRVVDRAGNYQSWIHGQDTNRYKRNTAGDAVYVRGLRFAGVAPAPAA